MLESIDATNPDIRPNSFIGCERDPYSIDVPVLIVGGGPAGLFQAHLLSQLGGHSSSTLLMTGVDMKQLNL